MRYGCHISIRHGYLGAASRFGSDLKQYIRRENRSPGASAMKAETEPSDSKLRTITLRPCSAKCLARFIATVVFPAPPAAEYTAVVRQEEGSVSASNPPLCIDA